MSNPYPTLRWIVDHGRAIVVTVGALPFVGALAAFVLLDVHWLALLAGLAASGVLLLVMKSYVELVALISDMLIPR